MTLRCRKGDLAMVIKSDAGRAVGKFVDVLEFYGEAHGKDNCWFVRYEGSTTDMFGTPYVQPDAWLLPIRPGDLDETEEAEKELEMAK